MCRMSEVRIAGIIVIVVCLVLIFVAFVTPNWLASDSRLYGARFEKLGLWESCLRSFGNPYDLEQRKYYSGCRWIFAEDYHYLRSYLEPPFFVATQVFFTIGFVLLLLACILLLAIQLCCTIDKEVVAFRALAALLIISALCCSIAVIVFAAHEEGRDFMTYPDHHFLSWSFILGVVGAILEYVAAILFLIESQLVKKRNHQGQPQVFGHHNNHPKPE